MRTIRSSSQSSVTLTMAIVGVSWALPYSAWPAPASPVETKAPSDERQATYEELMARAKSLREKGAHAESARSFAATFDVLPKAEKLGPMGELLVNVAVDDYRAAQERSPEDIGLVEEEMAIIRRFFAVRRTSDGKEVGLEGELQRANARLKELRLKQAEKLEARYEELSEEGNYGEAIPLGKAACSILEKELGRWSNELARCLNSLGVLHHHQQEYGKAEALYARALTIREKAAELSHPDITASLNNLAMLHKDRGEYKKAEILCKRALTIVEKALGPAHPDVARTLNNLAALYQAQGEYEEAEPLFERALAIFETALGPAHPDVAMALNDLAMLHWAQGEYKRAEPLQERALAIVEKAYDSEHPYVATSLSNLAALHQMQGEYEKAEPHIERALAIREKTLGPDDPDVALSLNNLASLYQAQGQYEKAERLFKRALSIREKILEPNDPDMAASLNNLAALYEEQGKYETAELLHERALAIVEKTLGPAHPFVAVGLNNLASLYRMRGEYEKAEPLQERSADIIQKTLGPTHPDSFASLNNLALLYEAQEKYERAEPILERTVTMAEDALGPYHPHLAGSLSNLAMLYHRKGEHEKAEPLYQRAVTIRRKVLGDEHPHLAVSLNNLAALYVTQRRYEEAELLYQQARAIFEKTWGDNHPNVAVSLNHISMLHLELGRYDSAAKFRSRALDIQYLHIGQSFLLAEEHRRFAYASTMSDSVDATLSSHLQAAPDHRPTAELALTTLLRRKGLVLNLGARSATAIRRTLPEEHLHLLDELAFTRDRYTALTKRGPGLLAIERFAEQLAEIQREQHQLWRDIGEHSPIVEALSKPIIITDVQRSLPPAGALVEYVRYFPKHHIKTQAKAAVPRYAAYIVFPDRFDWVDLGPTEPIEQHVAAFRRALQLKEPISTDLHEAVMQPILERIGDTRRLFIAPDAGLNLVPFGALHDGEHYLVERYDLHYLTTGRDLLRPWDAYASTNDGTVTVVANPTGVSLPGTEHEADLLHGLFPHVEPLLHDTATEANAQRRAQPWMLHLATHGFFEIPEPDPELERRMDDHILSMSPSALPFAPRRLDNPMLHSGLLLASADTPADPTTDPDDPHLAPDGRLTAYEISGWDLRGTELVVLSACGTGLGEPRAGEGVLGLRRAFAMAGAQTQVMSLWNVSDATTAKLMEAYYRELLDGKGRAEAMQEVQLEMLHSGEYHPGDWASFVVVGEWRPLSKDKLPKAEGPPPVEPRGCGCQRASVAGEAPPGLLVLALLGLLAIHRRPKSGHRFPRA